MHCAPVLVMVVIIVAACRPKDSMSADDPADVAAVERIAQDAAAAHQAGDSMRLASLFTEDAVVMTDGGESVTGRAAITSMFGGMLRQFTSKATIQPVETRVAGDWAFMRTAVSGTLVPRTSGAPIQLDGKEIAIAQRQSDGSWKVARLIGNSNRPTPLP